MIVWDQQYRQDLSLADALDRDARQMGAGIIAKARAWIARREAARLRAAYAPRPTNNLAASPSLNPDGTDRWGRVIDPCQFGKFHARKARLQARPSVERISA